MTDPAAQIFATWTPPPGPTVSLVLTALIYLNGWRKLRRTRPLQFTATKAACFLAGIGTLWLTVASPMDAFSDALLSIHMIEHLLIMSAVPPLVLLGLPVVPLLRGLPRPLLKALAPILRFNPLRSLTHWLLNPTVAWLAMNISLLAWHIPAAYDFALEHEGWHAVEHLCFLGTSLLFWAVIIRPWPMRHQTHRWTILVFLLSADLVNTALSAVLTFTGRPVYRFYLDNPNPFGIAPLDDQIAGAVIMWVVGSLVFVVPAIAVTLSLLTPQAPRAASSAPSYRA